ncbi:MAG: bifunctional metallophosphatase/5'-nucleotidase [Aquabacterium commune]|uniref:bifunctional metallophosphatase/5'-nucleotidase n=1 Tax=Aquabacterium commune TaxID=70586 RepID=UPI003BAFAB32|tara:strand:- start:4 stop:1956 length:1953 start_codon:yes stop_codon:yes gene_type:complete
MQIRLICASLALAFSSFAGCAVAQTATRAPFTVKIIGFNDFHGTLKSPGTFGQNTNVIAANRPTVGGADYVAGYIASLKSQNPLNVVVGAGDFIGASPLISALFFDEPTVEALNRIGLEFNAVGNHEFDKGAAELLRLQNGGCKLTAGGQQDPNSCRGGQVGTPVPFEGAKFKWLSANVTNTATGKTLLPAYGVKTFNGVKMAFIGMTLKATPSIVTPTGVAGLSFQDEADTVNALVPRLRAQGIESIVVLVHQGGFQTTPNLGDINGCDGELKTADGSPSDIAKIVARLDDAVDLVVSGHTHSAYNCSASTVATATVRDAAGVALKDAAGNTVTSVTPRPTGLPNKAGRLIPVTSASAFGRVLTDIDVTINPVTRNITAVNPTNRLVAQNKGATVAPIAAVTSLVTGYDALVSPLANSVIGKITTDLPNSADTSGNGAGNMPAGELIADAQLAATSAPDFGGAVIALMNPGGVRAPGFTFASSAAGEGNGNVTYGEAFTAQPFGNTLVTVTLSAQQLKNALEQQFVGCRGQGTQRILVPSAGFKYTYVATNACDSRIQNMRLVDVNSGAVIEQIVDASGAVVDAAKTYRVTINNFLQTGGDGFTTFIGGTSPVGGAQDIDALTAYLADYLVTPYSPTAATLQKPRITKQ